MNEHRAPQPAKAATPSVSPPTLTPTPRFTVQPAATQPQSSNGEVQSLHEQPPGFDFSKISIFPKTAASADPPAHPNVLWQQQNQLTSISHRVQRQPVAGVSGASSTSPLKSPRFQGIPDFEAVLRGQRLLRLGNCNGAVTFAIQGALAAVGHNPGSIDGLWGPKTNAAVIAFQRSAELMVDGIIGPMTLTQLDAVDPGSGTSVGGQSNPTGADPRLEHQFQKDGAGNSVDPEAIPGQLLMRLPYHGAHAEDGWKGETILKYWTQLDLDPTTATDEVRCAANAVVASRILSGPLALGKFCDELVKEGNKKAKSKFLDDATKAKVALKTTAASLAGAQIRMGFATYHTLNIIADAAKLIMTRNEQGASSAFEAGLMNYLGTGDDISESQSLVPDSINDVNSYCDKLIPGQAWVVAVDTRLRPQGNVREPKQTDHFITVGCLPNKSPKEGGIYLYDPWPRQGSQLIMRDQNRTDFDDYFFGSGGQMKFSLFMGPTAPKSI